MILQKYHLIIIIECFPTPTDPCSNFTNFASYKQFILWTLQLCQLIIQSLMIDCWLNTFTQSTRHKQHGEVTFYDHCNRNVVDDDARVTTCWLPVFASFSVGKKFHCNFNSTLAEPGFYHNVNDCNTGNQNKNWSFSPAAEQLWSSSLSPGDVRWCKSRHFSSYCTDRGQCTLHCLQSAVVCRPTLVSYQ